MTVAKRFYVETLGCPKNQVDSDKLIGTLLADGMQPTDDASQADLVVVNTCAFIDEARRESIDTILALEERRKDGARLVVTGCMAERYGHELAEALPEVDQVAGFGVPVNLTVKPAGRTSIPVAAVPTLDLLNLPRPRATAPWAYVKIAEGCDRRCGFCAIPTFRGDQRSRSTDDIVAEAIAPASDEIQDLKNRLEACRKIYLPLLENLNKNADQPIIKWPNRGPVLTKQIAKLKVLTEPGFVK